MNRLKVACALRSHSILASSESISASASRRTTMVRNVGGPASAAVVLVLVSSPSSLMQRCSLERICVSRAGMNSILESRSFRSSSLARRAWRGRLLHPGAEMLATLVRRRVDQAGRCPACLTGTLLRHRLHVSLARQHVQCSVHAGGLPTPRAKAITQALRQIVPVPWALDDQSEHRMPRAHRRRPLDRIAVGTERTTRLRPDRSDTSTSGLGDAGLGLGLERVRVADTLDIIVRLRGGRSCRR